jgi:DNA polymerase-4
MGAQHALGRGEHSPAEIDLMLLTLVDRVTRRMRESGRTGSTVTIRLRFGDFTRSTSSHTLARPTAHTVTVLDVARRLLASRSGAIKDKGITLIGVSLGSLDDQPAQLALPLDVTSGAELDDVIDAVRSKFGGAAVRRAVQLGQTDPGAAPHLPD